MNIQFPSSREKNVSHIFSRLLSMAEPQYWDNNCICGFLLQKNSLMLLVSKVALRLPGLAINFYCPYILDVGVFFL